MARPFLLLLVSLVAVPARAVPADGLRRELLRADEQIRKLPAGKMRDLVDTFREGPHGVTVARCSKAKGGDLTCEMVDYSLRALAAASADDLQVLGGEALKGVFALRKADDKTLATDFEVFCYTLKLPRLFASKNNAPFDAAFKKALADRCQSPTLANAQAFVKDAGPLLDKTCQLESDGAKSQVLKSTGENKWTGDPSDCDAARYDLHYDLAKKSGELTRTAIAVKGGDKCEDVFDDPLAERLADEQKVFVPQAPVVLAQGTLDTASCDYVRWSETFALLSGALVDDGKPTDPRYDAAVNALYEGDYESALKGLTEVLKREPGNGLAHLAFGIAKERTGKVDEALKEFDKAVTQLAGKKIGHSLDGRTVAYLHRGATRYENGKPKEALEDFTKAAQLEPTSFDAHFWTAAALGELRRDKESAAEFVRALSLRQSFERVTGLVFGEFGDAETMLADFVTPPTEEMLNAAAWRLAVSKDATVRDGARAVDYAKQAVDLTDSRNGRYLDTLAVAQAAAGNFKDAAQTEANAIEQVSAEGADKDETKAMEGRLALYKDGKIYTE
jgi:tetratricopeptide (TPR) repeat protein